MTQDQEDKMQRGPRQEKKAEETSLDGAVVKNLSDNAKDMGPIPGPGRSPC